MKKLAILSCVLIIVMAGCHSNSGNRVSEKSVCEKKCDSLQELVDTLQKQVTHFTQLQKAQTDKKSFFVATGLDKLNLSKLNFAWGWEEAEIVKEQMKLCSGDLLDVYDFLSGAVKGDMYKNFKLFLINHPKECIAIFEENKEVICQIKKHLNVPVFDLSYLEGTAISKAQEVEFVRYYKIHTSINKSVWDYHNWTAFEKRFFKEFPQAFDGNDEALVKAYMRWRKVHSMKPETKKTLITLIKEYNKL